MGVNEEEKVLVEYLQAGVQINNGSDQVLLFHLDEDPYEKKNLAAEFQLSRSTWLDCLTVTRQGWLHRILLPDWTREILSILEESGVQGGVMLPHTAQFLEL